MSSLPPCPGKPTNRSSGEQLGNDDNFKSMVGESGVGGLAPWGRATFGTRRETLNVALAVSAGDSHIIALSGNSPILALAAVHTSNLPDVALAAPGHHKRSYLPIIALTTCDCKHNDSPGVSLPAQAVDLPNVAIAVRAGDLTTVTFAAHAHRKRSNFPIVTLVTRGHCKCNDSPLIALPVQNCLNPLSSASESAGASSTPSERLVCWGRGGVLQDGSFTLGGGGVDSLDQQKVPKENEPCHLCAWCAHSSSAGAKLNK